MIDLFSMTRRARVLATASGAALALTGFAAGPAAASGAVAGANVSTTCNAPLKTVTGGTGTLDMTKSYIANMAANNIQIVPLDPILVDTTPETYTITTWSATGGQINPCQHNGSVRFDAGSQVINTATGKQMVMLDLTLNLTANTLDYTLQTPNGPVVIHGMTVGGHETWSDCNKKITFTASAVYMDPNAAIAMDNNLDTSAFTDTDLFGSGFTTTFSVQ
jgi:hypothetical protein